MKAIQRRKVPNMLVNTAKVLIFIGVGGAIATSIVSTAMASDSPWFVGDPQITVEATDPAFRSCSNEKIDVALLYPGNAGGALTANVDGCVTHGNTVAIASYSTPYQQYGIAVRYQGDRLFHHISGVSSGTLVPNTDTFAYLAYSGNYQYFKLTTTRNLAGALEPASRNGLGIVTSYQLKPDKFVAWMPYEDNPGANHAAYSYALSNNGRYIIAYIDYEGFVKIDLDTSQVTKVYAQHSAWYYAPDIPKANAISNDGRYAFVGMSAQMIDMNGCGDEFGYGYNSGGYGGIPHQCESVDFSTQIRSALGYTFTNTRSSFTDDSKGLEFESSLYPGSFRAGERGDDKHVTLHYAGYVAPAPLDYLALGDSISSGEGDTQKNTATNLKYYRPHTDVEEKESANQPREKCHISMRSYPYLLAKWMQLALDSPKQWDSVACSGATSTDIYAPGSGYDWLGSYSGQPKGGGSNTPRLEGYSNKEALQAKALNEMIPGRIEQIQFVEKYKPKVITLTAGANNIDFSGKLNACLNSLPIPTTCEWATTKRASLASQIQNEYDGMVDLYKKLYLASGNEARIYVLGYPQFISGDSSAQCKANIGSLNATEREMITSATLYLNKVIESAASKAGVKYIDISHALDGNKLCEDDQKYVNGIALRGSNEIQESFHPNDFGQIKIAQKVKEKVSNQILKDYDACQITDAINDKLCPDANAKKPEITEFSGVTLQSNSKNKHVVTDRVQKGTATNLKITKYQLQPGTRLATEIHSDPFNLGYVEVDTEGGVDTTIIIPTEVPAGYHTLIMMGQTYSGEPIEITQTVLVEGSDAQDVDENGIPDAQQPCGPFLQVSGQDADQDGIDDGCDPDITELQTPYRIRLGDPSRNYNGISEPANYLYIERNIYATNLTGISGDSDPDGDGWAIVGVSQGRGYSATSIPDTAPYANFIIDNYSPDSSVSTQAPPVPNVYLRAGDYGCVQYQPSTLAKVELGQVRTFKLIAQGTSKCRAEAPNADVDADGRPDNTQPLYMARNGDSTKGEDPTRTYLFRNFYATEAQLGISDYTPTGTPAGNPGQPIQTWNLLATSKDVGYSPIFNNLTLTTDANSKPWPIILARKHNTTNPSSNICIAYQPDSTSQIKLSTQSTRQLQLMKWKEIPEGVNCE